MPEPRPDAWLRSAGRGQRAQTTHSARPRAEMNSSARVRAAMNGQCRGRPHPLGEHRRDWGGTVEAIVPHTAVCVGPHDDGRMAADGSPGGWGAGTTINRVVVSWPLGP